MSLKRNKDFCFVELVYGSEIKQSRNYTQNKEIKTTLSKKKKTSKKTQKTTLSIDGPHGDL